MSAQGLQIRDAAYCLLENMPCLVVKTKAGVDSLQDNELPALSVVLARDDSAIDGDFAGPAHFLHRATLVITVRDKAASRDAIAAQLDAWTLQIEGILLTASKNDAAPTTGSNGSGAAFVSLFEGILSMSSSQPSSPLTGDSYFGDSRLEFVFQYRSEWPPNVPDIFNEMNISIEPNGDAAATVTDDHQLASAEFTFSQ